MKDHIHNYVFFVTIKAIDRSSRSQIAFLEWQDMPFEVRRKWDWYFTYRAALIQVQHPKAIIELYSGKTIPTGTQLENAHKNRIRAKKAKITEIQNKLHKARQEWRDLFPIEDNPLYPRAVAKLERLKKELQLLNKEDKCQ